MQENLGAWKRFAGLFFGRVYQQPAHSENAPVTMARSLPHLGRAEFSQETLSVGLPAASCIRKAILSSRHPTPALSTEHRPSMQVAN